MKYAHIWRAVQETPWALLPSKLATIIAVLEYHSAGETLTAEEIRQQIGKVAKPTGRVTNAVAVLPLYGILAHRANMMTESSGGTSVEQFTQGFRAAMADPNVSAVVLNVDSPGGSVEGVMELADEIYGSRGRKPVVAVASPMAASAAYWLASQADEVVVMPSGSVGSVGVLAMHRDESKAEEVKGIKTTIISAGEFKGEGNPYEPLAPEAQADIQGKVDTYYDAFVSAVARGRGVSPATVRAGYGRGRMVLARQAKAEGMVDRVDTLDGTIARLTGGRWRRPGAAPGAEVDEPEVVAVTTNAEVLAAGPGEVAASERRRRLVLA